MENCFYVLISQAVRYLKDPAIVPRDKQRLKQELSSELVSLHCWWRSRQGPRVSLTGARSSPPPEHPSVQPVPPLPQGLALISSWQHPPLRPVQAHHTGL